MECNVNENTPLYLKFPVNALKTGKYRGPKLPITPVGFRPWGGDEKTLVVEVPLDGAKDVLAAIKK